MKRIVVLISGSGSNLQAILDASKATGASFEVVGVISNRADAYGLQRAEQASVPAQVLSHKAFESREAYDEALVSLLKTFSPDLIVLAGFMRILTPIFIDTFSKKIVNIHPSLLPKYPGLNTHQRAIEAGEKEAGCTVHWVTQALDGGPIIDQAAVDILEGDTKDELAKRVLVQEHQLYPAVIDRITKGELSFPSDC